MWQNLKVVLVAVVAFGVIATSWVFSEYAYHTSERLDHGAALFAGVWGTVALFHYVPLLVQSFTKVTWLSLFQLRSRG